MKPYRFQFNRYHLIAAVLLGVIGKCATSCADQDPPPPSIEGHWHQVTSPWWEFTFENGIMTQEAKGFGATLSDLQFTYALRDDTLHIGGDLNNPPRRWLYKLLGPDDLKVTEIPADTALRVWPVFYFERAQ